VPEKRASERAATVAGARKRNEGLDLGENSGDKRSVVRAREREGEREGEKEGRASKARKADGGAGRG